MHSSKMAHWLALKRVHRYVKGIFDHGLQLERSFGIEIHVFSDWASDPSDWESTSGFAIFLGNNLIL